MSTQTPDIQRSLAPGVDTGPNRPEYLRSLDPPEGYTPPFGGLYQMAEHGFFKWPTAGHADDRGDSASEATPEEDDPNTLQDDRVVDQALTCHCGRPAGADGQCTACRMETAGDAIGNHGRRL